MPYTLAHPSAVLPLKNSRFLTPAGLIVGAMSPDFEHVLRLEVVSTFSHSWPALFYFCLPIGLLVNVAYRRLWRRPLTAVAPWLPDFHPPLWQDALSVLVGGATHIIWDSFTHRGRWGVEFFPILENMAPLPVDPPVAWHQVLQHSSTVVGSAVIAMAFVLHTRKAEPTRWWNLTLKTAVWCLAIGVTAWLLTKIFWSYPNFHSMIVLTANNILVLIAVSLTALGIFQRSS